MNIKQERELQRQADVVDTMQTVWNGRTKYFDEIVDAFASAGIDYVENKKQWEIKVPSKDHNQAYSILMELNELLEAGW